MFPKIIGLLKQSISLGLNTSISSNTQFNISISGHILSIIVLTSLVHFVFCLRDFMFDPLCQVLMSHPYGIEFYILIDISIKGRQEEWASGLLQINYRQNASFMKT